MLHEFLPISMILRAWKRWGTLFESICLGVWSCALFWTCLVKEAVFFKYWYLSPRWWVWTSKSNLGIVAAWGFCKNSEVRCWCISYIYILIYKYMWNVYMIYTHIGYIYIYTHVYIYLSIYASMHLCIYVSMNLFIQASMHVWIYASMHPYIYASMHLSIYILIEWIKAARIAAEDSSFLIYMYSHVPPGHRPAGRRAGWAGCGLLFSEE